jgi:predicted dehydrogenase
MFMIQYNKREEDSNMIRFGIIGAGGIAKKFASDIECLDNCKITAVSARSKEKANQYKKEYGVRYAFDSYQAMCDSNKIDAVYIATPHNFHKDHAIMAMRQKKHVLVEKPITVNAKELREMIKVANEENVVMMEAMWSLFLPIAPIAKNIFKNNHLGTPTSAEILFGYNLLDKGSVSDRWLNKDLAAGSLLDMGIYSIHYFLWLFEDDPIDTISSSCTWTETGVDATTTIDIVTKSGLSVTLISSLEQELKNDCMIYYSDEKYLCIHDFSRADQYIIDKMNFYHPFLGDGFVHEIDAFVKTINEGLHENPIMTHKRSLEALKLMDKVRKEIKLVYPFEKK